MTGKHMAEQEPAPDPDPRFFAYGDEPEFDQDVWPDEDSDQYDLDEPIPNDPLAFADEHMARLGLTLDFGPGDLAWNREGELSPAQVARLEKDLRLFYWPIIGALAFAALVLFFIGAVNTGVGILVPILVLMGLAGIAAVQLNRERQRLPNRQVQHTTLRLGGLSLTVRRWGWNDDNTLPVDGGKPVFAPKYVYQVLRANQTYLVYYVPVRTWRGYRLLSLEPRDDVVEKPKRKAKPKR